MKSIRYLFFPAWIILAGITPNCSHPLSQEADIIRIEGVSWACNITTSFASFGSVFETEEEKTLLIPASEGDLLYMMMDDQQLYYRYQPEKGTLLKVRFDTLRSVSAYLNGNLEFMEISGPSSLKAFNQLTDPEVQELSTLYITIPLNENILSTLKQHESALSGTGLVLEDSSATNDISRLLTICRPRLLIMDESSPLPEPGDINFLADLELLWVKGDMTALLHVEQSCEKLESLIIDDWSPGTDEVPDLSGLKKLQSITLAESYMASLSQIVFPSSINGLHLVNNETLTDISQLNEMSGLKRLCLTGCTKVSETGEYGNLGKLRWLSFPSNTTQDQFKEATEQLPQLKVIELIDCHELVNLFPLQSLTKLEILEMELEKEQLSGIDSLEQLKLIVLTSELFDDNPQWIKELKNNLPDCEIVPGSGLCLGSGWLALLLPLILMFRYLFRHKS
jgi:hypothetical protein